MEIGWLIFYAIKSYKSGSKLIYQKQKGFAVVASEVRKLAESTAKSTTDIETLTRSIQEEINKALTETETSLSIVNEGIQLSAETAGKIDLILEVIGTVQTEVESVLHTIKNKKLIVEWLFKS